MSISFSRVMIALLALPALAVADERPGLDAARFPKPTVSSAGEPVAAALSFAKAGEYLDRAAMSWLRDHRCASCHTNYPYLMARPMLGDAKAPALVEMRRFFDSRVAGWDRGGNGKGLPADEDEAVTEVVATATILAFDDARTTGKLRPLTRQALDRIWTIQREDGSWNWNKHEEAPQEIDEYFGAVFAALGVGYAPDGYAKSAAAKAGIARLKRYLTKSSPPNLHHKLWLMWASLRLDGLMSQQEREQTIKELLALQREDGGWNLPSLGEWKREDGKPNDKNAPSDGYASGLVIYVFRQAGIPAKNEAIQRGVAWLKVHQRVSGRWFTRSLNADRAHYITNAGTAYAVMALKACEEKK